MSLENRDYDFSLNQLDIHAGVAADAWQQRLQTWDAKKIGVRIWQHDASVWDEKIKPGTFVAELTDRLGWLKLPETMAGELESLVEFALAVKSAGFRRVVVLGMGGSSLIAEVWAEIFGAASGFLPVAILDSTHPQSVARMVADAELETTLFLVASKSGGTLETLSFFDYFYHRLSQLKDNPGANFTALTDPGSRLEELARSRNFRRIFHTPPEVGGRYSALTFFGLLPAALLGLTVVEVLAQARFMAKKCGSEIPAGENPALQLGAFLGEMVRAGRDKLILLLSPSLRPFAVWLEQLIAESIGKSGFGLVPVVVDDDELPLHDCTGAFAADSVYLFLSLAGDDHRFQEQAFSRIRLVGEPAARITLTELAGLGQEIWRFELATAAIGAVLGINPFDQPDVEAAKIGARQAMAAWEQNGRLPEPERLFTSSNLKVSGSRHFKAVDDLQSALFAFAKAAQPGDYISVAAFLPATEALHQVLQRLQKQLKALCRVPVTLGFGPRFLHSTGQLHKGDGNKGLFLQLSGGLQEDLKLPGSDYSFATLITAQAQGDYEALRSKNRRIMALYWFDGELKTSLLELIGILQNMVLPEPVSLDSDRSGS